MENDMLYHPPTTFPQEERLMEDDTFRGSRGIKSTRPRETRVFGQRTRNVSGS
jgi:hypothetical protein